MTPRWLRLEALLAVHEIQLDEHGGAPGVRDVALLESTVARPRQIAAYAATPPDVPTLAAAYGVGIVRNHPFVDGNKRVALVAVELFLTLNGYALRATDAECVTTMLALASGEIDEAAFAMWLKRESAKVR